MMFLTQGLTLQPRLAPNSWKSFSLSSWVLGYKGVSSKLEGKEVLNASLRASPWVDRVLPGITKIDLNISNCFPIVQEITDSHIAIGRERTWAGDGRYVRRCCCPPSSDQKFHLYQQLFYLHLSSRKAQDSSILLLKDYKAPCIPKGSFTRSLHWAQNSDPLASAPES